MLVLSRQRGDGIVLPQHDVEIVVVSINGDKVRLGVRAPDTTAIYRAEVWTAIERDAARRVAHTRKWEAIDGTKDRAG